MYSIKNEEELENSNELISLQNQVKAARLQDKLGKQKFHENLKKLYEPLTDTIKDVSEDTTTAISETSITSNKALQNLNTKLLEIMNDRGILASYLLSSLSKIPNPENSAQIKIIKDSNSNRLKDLLIKTTIPITLHDNLLTFRDTGKVFELKGELLKLITNKN